jgi:hypothetical protein
VFSNHCELCTNQLDLQSCCVILGGWKGVRECVWWVYVILIPPYKVSFVVEDVKYHYKTLQVSGCGVLHGCTIHWSQLLYMVEHPHWTLWAVKKKACNALCGSIAGLIKNLKNKSKIKHQMQCFQATGNRLVIINRSLLTCGGGFKFHELAEHPNFFCFV